MDHSCSVLVVSAQHIHDLVVGGVIRYVVMIHEVAHASLHTRDLTPVIGSPVLLPTRIVAAEAARVVAREPGNIGAGLSSC